MRQHETQDVQPKGRGSVGRSRSPRWLLYLISLTAAAVLIVPTSCGLLTSPVPAPEKGRATSLSSSTFTPGGLLASSWRITCDNPRSLAALRWRWPAVRNTRMEEWLHIQTMTWNTYPLSTPSGLSMLTSFQARDIKEFKALDEYNQQQAAARTTLASNLSLQRGSRGDPPLHYGALPSAATLHSLQTSLSRLKQLAACTSRGN